jgi:hypothetical protein
MAPSAGSPFDGAEIISSYSRAQALEDGELVDVSETAREAGIRFPVAVTRALWAAYVEVPRGVSCQDETGRLWDVVSMLRFAIARSQGGSELRYQLRASPARDPQGAVRDWRRGRVGYHDHAARGGLGPSSTC